MARDDTQSADQRFPRRMACSQTRLPFALEGEPADEGGACPREENRSTDPDRFEFGCSVNERDCLNGYVIRDGQHAGQIAVEIYQTDEAGDYTACNMILSAARARELAAWLTHHLSGEDWWNGEYAHLIDSEGQP